MGDGRREVSRRGLFGVFGRGLRRLQDDLARSDAEAAGEPPPSEPSYERIRRPEGDVVRAFAGGPGTWNVDLTLAEIEVGESVVARSADLPEPLVIVRVHEGHLAACTAECPVDGSELAWRHADDVLACPSCDSRWRLDGSSVRGPADSDLARLVVDVYRAEDGTTEIRVTTP